MGTGGSKPASTAVSLSNWARKPRFTNSNPYDTLTDTYGAMDKILPLERCKHRC